jgi:GNAT superfamily N-acetyltransferase
MTPHQDAHAIHVSEKGLAIRIDYLCNHRHLIPELSSLLYAEWHDLYQAAALTQQDLISALEQRCVTNVLPLTLVAVDAEGQLVGAGSIKLDEPGTKVGLSPWLGGIYIKQQQRGLGLGAQIVTALERQARALGVSALYLSADTAEAFYLRLGWQVLERLESLGVRDVALMTKQLS